MHVKGLVNGVQMKKTSGKLQVGVRDGPARVCVGDEAARDELRPLKAPEHWHIRLVTGARLQFIAWEAHSPGPFPCRVMVTLRDWSERDEFGQSRRPGREVLRGPPEVIELLMNSFSQIDPSL